MLLLNVPCYRCTSEGWLDGPNGMSTTAQQSHELKGPSLPPLREGHCYCQISLPTFSTALNGNEQWHWSRKVRLLRRESTSLCSKHNGSTRTPPSSFAASPARAREGWSAGFDSEATRVNHNVSWYCLETQATIESMTKLSDKGEEPFIKASRTPLLSMKHMILRPQSLGPT